MTLYGISLDVSVQLTRGPTASNFNYIAYSILQLYRDVTISLTPRKPAICCKTTCKSGNIDFKIDVNQTPVRFWSWRLAVC